MSKKTQVVTPVTDTAKVKPENTKLAKKNLKDSAKTIRAEKQPTQETATQREVKYNYPEDCKTPDLRKEFRRKARATARKLDKKLQLLAKSEERGAKTELKEVTKELHNWKQSTYTHLN